MKVFDLSMVVAPAPDDPSVRVIERWTHEAGPGRISAIAGPYLDRLAAEEGWSTTPDLQAAFPDDLFLANDVVTLTVHAGTHVDAPWHYGPRSEGSAAKTVADLPLSWLFGRGVKLSVRDTGAGELIGPDVVRRELDGIGHVLQPGDVVLLETGWDAKWPHQEYFDAHPGLSVAALDLLLDQGVRLIGIDTAGLDRPAPVMLADFGRSGDPAVLWPCHLHGREREYLQIERMANLGQLPDHGFWVLSAPVRVDGASAGWARAVALVLEPSDLSVPGLVAAVS